MGHITDSKWFNKGNAGNPRFSRRESWLDFWHSRTANYNVPDCQIHGCNNVANHGVLIVKDPRGGPN